MLLEDVLHDRNIQKHPVLKECSEFLSSSEGFPILKNFSSGLDLFHKLKLRQRNKRDNFTKTFNEAFHETPNLRQRSLTSNGELSFIAENGDFEPYYVFPIDGFKYLYSLEVTNSKEDYQESFDTILEMVEDKRLTKDILKYTYTSEKLAEGIRHGSEIIIYNIPYCYIQKASSIRNYEEFIKVLE